MSRRGPTQCAGQRFAESVSPVQPWWPRRPRNVSLAQEPAMNNQDILWISSWAVAMILLMGIWLALWD